MLNSEDAQTGKSLDVPANVLTLDYYGLAGCTGGAGEKIWYPQKGHVIRFNFLLRTIERQRAESLQIPQIDESVETVAQSTTTTATTNH